MLDMKKLASIIMDRIMIFIFFKKSRLHFLNKIDNFLIDVFHCVTHNKNNCDPMKSTIYVVFKNVWYLCANVMSYLKPFIDSSDEIDVILQGSLCNHVPHKSSMITAIYFS